MQRRKSRRANYIKNRYFTTEDTEAHRVLKIKIITSVVLCDLCGENQNRYSLLTFNY